MKLSEIKWEAGKKYRDNLHNITWVVVESILGYGFLLFDDESDDLIEDVFYTNQLVTAEFEEVEAY